jgi:integrase
MSKIRARTDNGKLFFDFFFRGQRCREQTTLDDTPANRKNMEQVLARIEAEKVLGVFQYSKYFPNSANALKFDGAEAAAKLFAATAAAPQPAATPTPTLEDFSRIYRRENSVQWRQSTREWIDLLIDRHLLPSAMI